MPPPPPSLKARALRLLSQREHARRELERKLARHAPDAGELRQVLDELQAKGFISDRRAAESVLHLRSARVGLARIRQELQAKGIDPQEVQESLAQLQATEFARAREVWRRRFGAPPGDLRERARQARFLLARGFGADVVRRVLASAGADMDGDDGIDDPSLG